MGFVPCGLGGKGVGVFLKPPAMPRCGDGTLQGLVGHGRDIDPQGARGVQRL